jgi:hypothetical protein
MQSPDILAMRIWLGLDYSRDEIDLWFGDYISETPNADALAYDTLNAPHEIKTHLFLEFVRTRLGFEYLSARGMAAIEAILLELTDCIQARSLSVPDFCKSVRQIDGALSGLCSGLSWPEGLGELWNACDWCDDGWTFDNQPHLEPIIEDVRRKLRSKAFRLGS